MKSETEQKSIEATAMNVDPSHATLYLWDGSQATPIGYVVTGPQDCGDGQYGTAEWIQEITFVQTQNEYTPALAWLVNRTSHRVSDASGTTGCGHISKNVPVYKLARDPYTGLWSDSSDAKYNGSAPFYCLVAAGTPGTPKFKATAIWISSSDWPGTLDKLQEACKRDIPPSRKCAANSKGPPCNRVPHAVPPAAKP